MLDNIPIADPYFGGKEGFEIMFQHINSAMERLEKKLCKMP